MIRNWVIAQRKMSVHTHLWTKFCALHSGTMFLIHLSDFYPEKKYMLVSMALHDQKSLSFLKASLLLFSITYPAQSQVSWVGTNSNMLLWIYCFYSRLNIDIHCNIHLYYFNLVYSFIIVSLRPSLRIQMPEWRQVWYFLESQNSIRKNTWSC